jgi:putative colanic acid biosynthesis acetyltransferase WcaF
MTLDIESARSARPYSTKEYLGRIAWSLAGPFFYLSPRPLFAWRRFMLRLFGASVGKAVNIYPNAKIYIPWNLEIGDHASIGEEALIYNLGKVKIGARSTVSHRAHICAGTHDYRDAGLPLLRQPIDIGSDVWVCAQSFIGPNIKIGDGAVIGAGAVVMKSVEPWSVLAGNPAEFVKKREMKTRPS